MKRIIATLFLFSFATLANALDDDSIIGTYSVKFQPTQVDGELHACTLLFRAVQYLDGSPVMILGNIGNRQVGANLHLTLKVGVKNLVGNGPIVRPNFAYLQTKSYSTAKVKQKAMNGDEGFRLYAYSLFDPTVLDLYKEIMDSSKVTVGFNRKKGGMDVLVPIDLSVSDVEYLDGDKVVRKRSNEAVSNFVTCSATLLNQVKESMLSEAKKK
jgi:hypothetical protein